MNRALLGCILTLTSFHCACAACTFPTDLIGIWESLSYGRLTFDSSSFSGFTSAISVATLTFTCEISSGSQYVAKSTVSIFSGVTSTKYLCMNLEALSSVMYKMTLEGNKEDITNVRVYTSDAATVTLAEVCATTDARSTGEFDLLISTSSTSVPAQACPDDFLYTFNVTMETSTTTNCDNNTLDGTISNTLLFTHSSCGSSVAFNTGGHLNCIYDFTDGGSYLITYNNDTSIDGSTKFRFTCIAYNRSGGVVYATEYPTACQTTQTYQSVPSPGISYVLAEIGYVAPTDAPEASEAADNTVLIAVVVTVSIVLVIGIVIAVIWYIKCYKKKPRPPTPEPPRKKKKKPKPAIINEYLPQNQKSPRAVDDKGLEFVNELTKNRSSHRIDNFKEPAKPKWQNKWEKDMRPPTPSSLLASKKYPSAGGLSSLTGFSSSIESLPATMEDDRAVIERLAKEIENSRKVEGPAADAEVSKPDTEKEPQPTTSDAKPVGEKAAQESTSKPINETIHTPRMSRSPRLKRVYSEGVEVDKDKVSIHTSDTETQTEIKHEDFSPRRDFGQRLESSVKNYTQRPLSTVPEDGQETGDKPHLPLDNRSLITDTGTYSTLNTGYSTLTARGIQLGGFNNDASTISRLSVSSSSIFDVDDRFLQGSYRDSDSIFSRGSTLLPELKRSKSLNTEWFTKTQFKLDTLGDNSSYYNTRSKQSLSVGLNNKTLPKSGKMSSSKYAKSQRRTQSQRTLVNWKYEWEHMNRPKTATALVRRLSCHHRRRPHTAHPLCRSRHRHHPDRGSCHSPESDLGDTRPGFEHPRYGTPDSSQGHAVTFTDVWQQRPTSSKSTRSIHSTSIMRPDSSLKGGRKARNKHCQTDEYLFFLDDPVAPNPDGDPFQRPPTPFPQSPAPPTNIEKTKTDKDRKRSRALVVDTDVQLERQDSTRPPTPYPRSTDLWMDDKEADIRETMVSRASLESTDVPIPISEMPKSTTTLSDGENVISSEVSRLDLSLSRENTGGFPPLYDRPDTVLSRARTELALSHLKVDYRYDTVSLYSELFYPENWIEDGRETETEEYWRQGSAIWSKQRKSSKHWFIDPMPPVNN